MSIPYPARSNVVDAISFNQLVLPGHELEFMPYVIAGGQQLVAGSVLGRVTTTGLLKLCVNGAGDGSEVPMAILMEDLWTVDVDGVTARDTPMSVAVAGHFNRTALYLDPSFNTAALKAAAFDDLRKVSIYSRTPGYSG